MNATKLIITDFKAKIDEWINKGLENELVDRLMLIKDYDNKEHFEQTIEVIFYLANKKSNYLDINIYPEKLILYPSEELFQSQLFNSNDKISNLYENNSDWKVFINRFFENAQTPFYFEAELLHYFINNCKYSDPISILPFTLEKGLSLLETYFKKYTDSINRIEDDEQSIWRLYHACKSEIKNKDETVIYSVSELIKGLFIKCIQQKDVDGFIKAILTKDLRSDNYGIHKEVISIFENWDHFMTFLEEQPDGKWNYLKEFLAFCSLRNASNFTDYIEYPFETIPVKEWFKQ